MNDTVLLIQPPYGDVTYPYHSLAYVAAAVKSSGYKVEILDFNALWFQLHFNQVNLQRWAQELRLELDMLSHADALTITQQDRVADVLKALAICESIKPEDAAQVMKSERFYDRQSYQGARSCIRAFESLLNVMYPGFDFFGAFSWPPFINNALELATKVKSNVRMKKDFVNLLNKHCKQDDYLFVGVSMSFSAELQHGFTLLDAVNEVFSNTLRLAGGTAVTDIAKYCNNADGLQPLSDLCDFLYVGEAEVGLDLFFQWLAGKSELPQQIIRPADDFMRESIGNQYVALGGEAASKIQHKPFDWAGFPPYFDWVEWALYLAPERGINYSPVRGCFWNKCTFCDYGLNTDMPAAPSRIMNVEVALDHISYQHDMGIKHFYLSSDAFPPSFLRKFAQGLIERKLKISWTCQLFLTKTFDQKLVSLLQDSGMCLASFGLESGSSDVLENMGKGPDRVNRVLNPVLKTFSESNIAMQPLFFFGFPNETDADRQKTVDLLIEYKDLFCPISKGGVFSLLEGSIIASKPADFGITNIRDKTEPDFSGVLEFDSEAQQAHHDCEVFRQFNDQLPYDILYERPWAGGVDTLHSHLWIERYGRNAFRVGPDKNEHFDGPIVECTLDYSFDLDALSDNVAIHRVVKQQAEDYITDATLKEQIASVLQPLERSGNNTYKLSIRSFREL